MSASVGSEASRLARSILRLLGGDAEFERLVDEVLSKLRAALHLPTTPGWADPVVEREFAGARARLASFGPEFAEIQEQLLIRHVGAEHLAGMLVLLEGEHARRWLGAREAIAPQLSREIEALSRRMRDAVLYEAP